MNNQFDLHEVGVVKIISGVLGALVSLRFMQGTLTEKIFMSIGGSSLSYFATSPISDWLHSDNTEGLIGFIVGLFGMAVVAKGYEALQFIDAKRISQEVLAWLIRKWGA